MEHTDIVIIGAGVVGLAIAAKIVEKYPDYQVIILERNEKYGQDTSSRNSEVIHSGIYYPEGSLKAELCVKGNELLYNFCDQYNVPYQKLGKLIIAIEEDDIGSLKDLATKAEINIVKNVDLLTPEEVKQMEPEISSRGALLIPSTGIIDSHTLMKRLEEIAMQKGAMFAYCHEVEEIESINNGYKVEFCNPDGSFDAISCTWLINSAGLYSDRIAEMLGIDIDKEGYRIHLCKGEYFSIVYSKGKLIKKLIYPPPLKELQGLGIHLTKNLDGRLRLGPNAFYIDQLDYTVNPDHVYEFFDSVKSFLPFLKLADLEPEMAGIRPKIQGPNEPVKDFIICHESARNLSGVINLIGIESPGLTCCLSIADKVSDIIQENQ